MKKQTFLFRTNMKKIKMLDESPQRKLLQDVAAIIQGKTFLIKDPSDGEIDEGAAAELSPPQPIFQPFNFSARTPLKRNEQHQQASSLDSSMALTILVLLTALFFMGFFSLYLRRYAAEGDPTSRRRRLSYLPAGSVFSVSGNQKGKGLDVSTVRSLPLVSYGEDVNQVIFTDCPICLSEFEQAEIVKIIPHCRHVFHPKCIDTWLASHVSCPFCRSTKLFKDEDGSDVKRVQDNNGVGESGGRSTATIEEGYTWTWREVGIRRICSWTKLEDRVVLQRSLSF